MFRTGLIMGFGVIIAVVTAAGFVSAYGQDEGPEPGTIPNLSLDEAINAIQSQDPKTRFDGAVVLCSMGPKAGPAVGPVMEILKKHDPARYMELLHVLIAVGPEAKPAVPVLLDALDSKNFHVRYLSCRALGHTGTAAKPAVAKLIKLVDDPITSVRRNAAKALGNLGPKVASDAVPALLRAAQEHRYVVKIEAILALGKLGDAAKPALPVLKQTAKNPKSAERAQAAWALFELTGDTELTLQVLAEELNRIDRPWEAAEFLVQMAPKVPMAVEVLSTGLQNPDATIRTVAAEAIGKTGVLGKRVLMNLKGVLADSNPDVQSAARKSVQQIEKAMKIRRQEDEKRNNGAGR